MPERRLETRLETEAPVVITPLSGVTSRVLGSVVNVSSRGLRVHADAPPEEHLAAGNIFRVQCGDDLMLCEIRHGRADGETAEIGFSILHWVSEGKLNRLAKELIRLTA